ncbi:MAG: hypothetical protein HDT39_12600 [Lachnospiraceae bacterium]|nr:hypothetical protein [Lachnospiraceae bacterium]
MKNNRKIVVLLILMIFILFSSGCDSRKQREINKSNIKGAKANAANYIKEKYGFEATVKTAILERRGMWLGSEPLTTVLLEMEYCGKIFNVYIDGSYDNTDGMDNYQTDEIKSALKELADDTVSGVRDVWIDSGDNASASKGDIHIFARNMFSDYYDGTNLFEMISEHNTEIVFEYVQTDVYKNDDWSAWDGLVENNVDMSVKFISYRSQEALENGIIRVEERYAVYIDNYCSLYNEGPNIYKDSPTYVVETNNYVLHETNGFYYYVVGNENENVKITEIEPYDLSLWDSDRVKKVVSPAFLVKADKECEIYIFYPISAIDAYNTDYTDQAVAVCYRNDGETEYRDFSLIDSVMCEEYSVSRHCLEGEDDFFYFMYTQGIVEQDFEPEGFFKFFKAWYRL